MLFLIMMLADEKDRGKILGIFDKYHTTMLRYARSLLAFFGDKNYIKDGEDVVQNAFLNIVRSIDRIDTTLPENVVGGYLMKIVKNEATNFIKTQRKHVPLDEMLTICEDCDFLEEFSRKELYKKVVREIENLGDIYREVMIMNFIDGMSVIEIAKKLGVSEQTVYTRRARAIEMLREIFKDEVI